MERIVSPAIKFPDGEVVRGMSHSMALVTGVKGGLLPTWRK